MPEQTHSTCFIRLPDLVSAEMDGDLVMMSIENGEYYGIGGVGPRIWALLETPMSIDQLVQTITAEFDVERERCQSDIEGFVAELHKMRLIKTVEA